jgi:hypothetical protein
MRSDISISRTSIYLGFWAALCGALVLIVFTVCLIAVLAVNPIFMWTNIADYAAYARAHRSLWPSVARLSVLLFGPLFVLILNSIHDYARDEHKPLSRLGLCFGLAFAVLTGTHYFVQLSAVRIAELSGRFEGLEQIVQANPYSAISAINMLGWTLFLGLASLCVAPVFSGSRLERVIRVALFLNGIFCILGGFGYVFEQVAVVFLAINLGMGGAITIGTIALCLLFKRLGQAPHHR